MIYKTKSICYCTCRGICDNKIWDCLLDSRFKMMVLRQKSYWSVVILCFGWLRSKRWWWSLGVFNSQPLLMCLRNLVFIEDQTSRSFWRISNPKTWVTLVTPKLTKTRWTTRKNPFRRAYTMKPIPSDPKIQLRSGLHGYNINLIYWANINRYQLFPRSLVAGSVTAYCKCMSESLHSMRKPHLTIGQVLPSKCHVGCSRSSLMRLTHHNTEQESQNV